MPVSVLWVLTLTDILATSVHDRYLDGRKTRDGSNEVLCELSISITLFSSTHISLCAVAIRRHPAMKRRATPSFDKPPPRFERMENLSLSSPVCRLLRCGSSYKSTHYIIRRRHIPLSNVILKYLDSSRPVAIGLSEDLC